jgi:hypothetical protein
MTTDLSSRNTTPRGPSFRNRHNIGDLETTPLCEVGHQGLFHDEELPTAGDGACLIHNRARTLHPGAGRFMQRDPHGTMNASNAPRVGMAGPAAAGGFVARDPMPTRPQPGLQYADGMNLYQYALRQPLTRRDPSGQISLGQQILITYLGRASRGRQSGGRIINIASQLETFRDDGTVSTWYAKAIDGFLLGYAYQQELASGKWESVTVSKWQNAFSLPNVSRTPIVDGSLAAAFISTPYTLDAGGSYEVCMTSTASKSLTFLKGLVRNVDLTWRLTDRMDANSLKEAWDRGHLRNETSRALIEALIGDVLMDKVLGASFDMHVFFDQNEYNVRIIAGTHAITHE